MPVECRRAIVLGVNYESEGRWGGAQRTLGRVNEKGGAESTAAKLTVDGKPADAHGWNERISRQPLCHGGRKLGTRNAGSGQCVVRFGRRFGATGAGASGAAAGDARRSSQISSPSSW